MDYHNVIRCKGYSIFVGKVRKYTQIAKQSHTKADYERDKKDIIKNAVIQAVDECTSEGILRDFFIKHREEAIEMSIFECTAEEHIQYITEGSFDNGFDNGVKVGKAQGLSEGISIGISQGISQGVYETNSVYSWLYSNGRKADMEKAFNDAQYRDKLFKEYKSQKNVKTLPQT